MELFWNILQFGWVACFGIFLVTQMPLWPSGRMTPEKFEKQAKYSRLLLIATIVMVIIWIVGRLFFS